MLNKILSATAPIKKKMLAGIMYGLGGAEPVERGAQNIWRMAGMNLEMGGHGGFKIASAADWAPRADRWLDNKLGFNVQTGGELAGFGAAALGTGWAMYDGYQRDGFFGMQQALTWEMAIGAGVAAHGFKWKNNKVVSSSIPLLGRGNAGNQVLRTLVGSAAAIGLGGAIGGSLGTGVGAIAGYGAAAAAPQLAIATGAIGAAALLGYGATSVLKAGYNHRQMQKNIHTSGSLAAFHTQSAQTMRARAVQAIGKSHLNARSALGQEANFMHFPSKSYNSRYRM